MGGDGKVEQRNDSNLLCSKARDLGEIGKVETLNSDA